MKPPDGRMIPFVIDGENHWKCTKCLEVKHHTLFSKHSARHNGLNNLCKQCAAKKDRRYYKNNKDSVREKDLAYAKSEHGKKVISRRRKRYKDKARAYNIVYSAVKNGTLIRPNKCPVCGVDGERIEAHHEDYSKPLEVKWMCAKCHMEHHRIFP